MTHSLFLRIFLSLGTIGQISVKIEVLQNDASAGSDFIASEPIFTFADKDNSSQNYLLTIKDDNIPEIDEEFVIKLVNPTGGARVAPGLGNNVTIIIQANDGVAGQVGFDEQSRSVVAMEGSQVSLLVNRTRSNGRVSVDWLIAKANASSDFTDVSGTVVFNEVWAFRVFLSTCVFNLVPIAGYCREGVECGPNCARLGRFSYIM